MRTIAHESGWSWDFAQLANGLLIIDHDVVPFEDGCMGSVRVDRACLHRVCTTSECSLILVPAPESGAVYLEGRRLVAGDAVLLPQADELELLTHAAGRVFLIALPGIGASPLAGVRGPRWCARADGRAGELPEILRRRFELSGNMVMDLAQADALRLRARSCLKTMLFAAQSPEGGSLALPRRRMAVERVRRFIHAHLADPMTLADLCLHAHLQARSLEYGFRELVGLSPFKYIKILRLGEVRRRLLRNSAAQLSVSEAALDCGFSHLSQFAADYKRTFLESPSATPRPHARCTPIPWRSSSWPGRARVIDGISPNNSR